MAEFIAKCPKCGAGFEAQEEWVGQEGECPACGEVIPIEAPLKKAPQKKVVSRRPSLTYAPKPHAPKQENEQAPVPATSASKAKMGVTVGAIAAVAIILVCGAVFLFHGKSKQFSSQSLGTIQVAAEKKQEKMSSSDEKAWLSSNRSIIIDLASTASAFFKSSEFEKADAKYGMLFKIVGDRAFKDETINDVVETARQEYDQMKASIALETAKKASSLDDSIRCVEDALKTAKYDSNKTTLSKALEEYGNTKKETANMLMGVVSLKKRDGGVIHPRPKIIIIKRDEILDEAYAGIAAEVAKDNEGREGGAFANVGKIGRDMNILKAYVLMSKRIQSITKEFIESKKDFAQFALLCSGANVDEDGSFSCKIRGTGKYYLWTEMPTIGRQNAMWVMPIEKEAGKGLIINLNNENVILTDQKQ